MITVNRLYILVLSVATAATLLSFLNCDRVTHGAPVGKVYFRHTTQSCQHSGPCFKCSPDMSGNMSCGYKFSLQCDGEQPVQVRASEWVEVRKSGKEEKVWKDEVVKVEGDCE